MHTEGWSSKTPMRTRMYGVVQARLGSCDKIQWSKVRSNESHFQEKLADTISL